ncbi:hypothetical protein TWF694_005819 [Orbilia ellipsospora]|uniref:Uncharacterized protein n=1 Tax=Orbilia ellipsospora TaxID=2528407 RepID=A0AAV9WSC5_9PEZI
MSKPQEHSGGHPSQNETILVASTNNRLTNQEHWSQDTLDVVSSPSENAVLPSLSKLEYKLSSYESTSSKPTRVNTNEISTPRVFFNLENEEIRLPLPPKPPGYNSPEHVSREAINTVYRGSPPLSPTPFHFDEDDLSETEDPEAEKIKFHETEMKKRIENGQYDEILQTHLKALIQTYKITTDIKIILLYSIMEMNDFAEAYDRLIPFKFDPNVEPDFNIALYLLRAQLLSLLGNPKAGQSCRRVIKLCEQYKTQTRVDAETARNLDRWSNAAYKILLKSMGKIADPADRLYWDSKYKDNIRDPVLRFSAKLQLRVIYDNLTPIQASINHGEPEERELLDSIPLLDLQSRPNPSAEIPSLGAVVKVPQSILTKDDEEVLQEDFRIGIEKDKNGILMLHFAHRENLLKLLESSLQSGMYDIAVEICKGDPAPLVERTFAFDHPPVDPFAYHPPYANMTDALIPVHSALTLLATLGNTREEDTEEWDTSVAATCLSYISKSPRKLLSPPPSTFPKPHRRRHSRRNRDEDEEEEDDEDYEEEEYNEEEDEDYEDEDEDYEDEDEDEEESDEEVEGVSEEKKDKEDNQPLKSHEIETQLELALRISISLDNHPLTAKIVELHPSLFRNNLSLVHLVIRTSYTGDATMLRRVLSWTQPDFHHKDPSGRNILHFAAYYSIKSVEAMRCLVEYHKCRGCWARVAKMRGVGYTPFQMAKVARARYRVGSTAEEEAFVDEFVEWMLKSVGPWVVDPLNYPSASDR